MSDTYRKFALFLLVILTVSCAAPPICPSASSTSPNAQIARYPAPDDYSRAHVYTKLPTRDPNSDSPFEMDLRSANLEKFDLSGSQADLLYAMFDSKTRWPSADKMPADFDWQKIMELGKDPVWAYGRCTITVSPAKA